MNDSILGVPREARTQWEALGEALSDLPTPVPCQSPDRDLWAGNPASQRRAAARCLDCPVMIACGDYAVAAGERHGVWGGLTAGERKGSPKGGAR